MRGATTIEALQRDLRSPRNSLLAQLALLLLVLFVSAIAVSFLGYTPAVRLSWSMIVPGIFWGVVALAIFATANLLNRRKGEGDGAHAIDLPLEPADLTVRRVSYALSRSCGDELLLRGVIFGYLALRDLTYAFTVNFLLSAVLSALTAKRDLKTEIRESVPHAGLKTRISELFFRALPGGLVGSLLALSYLMNRSLFLVAIARFIVEFAAPYIFDASYYLSLQRRVRGFVCRALERRNSSARLQR